MAPRILRPKQIQKIKVIKIKIRSAQNISKIFLSRKKTFPAPFGALPANFLRGPEKSKKRPIFAYFLWWANALGKPALDGNARWKLHNKLPDLSNKKYSWQEAMSHLSQSTEW